MIAVVGAGITGATIANRLAYDGHKVLVLEKSDHAAGTCFDTNLQGTITSLYGPHIFHTNNKRVFDFLSYFTKFIRYDHKVLGYRDGSYFNVPPNINTINSIFNTHIQTESEARELIYKDSATCGAGTYDSETAAILRVGRTIYEHIFKEYTFKQWGVYPKDLDPSVLARIPIRFNHDDRYFTDRYQGVPVYGYTDMVQRMLSHPNIEVMLETPFTREMCEDFDHVFYTGTIDQFFDYSLGKLPYRSVKFDIKFVNPFYQRAAVVNYCSLEHPCTRITDYSWFPNNNTFNSTSSTISIEYPSDEGDPYYPILTQESKKLYSNYCNLVKSVPNITFAGRLGTFRYINMDQAVEDGLRLTDLYLLDNR